MRVGYGNAVSGNYAIYARDMRYRALTLCPIGAMGLHHIHLFNKMKLNDFNNNKIWFNKKLFIPLYSEIKTSKVDNNDIIEDRIT